MIRIDITGNSVEELKRIVAKYTTGQVVVVNNRAYIISYEDEKNNDKVKKVVKENEAERIGKNLLQMGDELTDVLIGGAR